jgi:hypothetical protein
MQMYLGNQFLYLAKSVPVQSALHAEIEKHRYSPVFARFWALESEEGSVADGQSWSISNDCCPATVAG